MTSFDYAPDLDYGSVPKQFAQIPVPENKPRILLMGLRRSGKSSIQKVVFHKMSPIETMFLEATSKIHKDDIANSSFVQFQVWDFPGQVDFLDSAVDVESIFRDCGALVYVMDALAVDDYTNALTNLHKIVVKAMEINPKIHFQLFIHKVDALTDDLKMQTQQNIQQSLHDMDEVAETKMNAHIAMHLTNIYDHSIFEAFSKVIQQLIPQLPVLEYLLNILNLKCCIEKSFLVDVVSKIYIATDNAPVETQRYELCSDMIDVVIDMSCIYGMKEDSFGLAYDDKSRAVIKLSDGMVLYLREVNRYLALVAVMRSEQFEKKGIIDYNFQQFKTAITEVFSPSSASSSSSTTTTTTSSRK